MNQPNAPSTSALEHVAPPPSKAVPSRKPRASRRRWLWLSVLILLALLAYFLWQKNKGVKSGSPASAAAGKKGGKGSAAIPVVATRARKGDIGVYFQGLGNVTPIHTVSV